MLYEMMRTMSVRVEKELNTISIQMEKELAQNMIIELTEKLKSVNEHGMLGVVTTLTSILPLIRCDEGAPELAGAIDEFSRSMMGRIRNDRALIFEEDSYKNRESFFKGISVTKCFLDEAAKYFGKEYTEALAYSLGFEA